MFKYPLSTESKVFCYALNNPEVDVSRSVSYKTMEKIWYYRSNLYTFAQYVFHQNDRVILLSYRQFIISTNVIECYMI